MGSKEGLSAVKMAIIGSRQAAFKQPIGTHILGYGLADCARWRTLRHCVFTQFSLYQKTYAFSAKYNSATAPDFI